MKRQNRKAPLIRKYIIAVSLIAAAAVALVLGVENLTAETGAAAQVSMVDDIYNNNPTDLSVVVTSSEILSEFDYVKVDAAMSATITRDDGSQGAYKVPFAFFYPLDAEQCNDAGIVDVVNSVFYETFPSVQPLFPFARLFLGDNFIFGPEHGGYVYARVQWNKLVIDRQRELGALADETLNIERGTDGYLIIRDASRALRDLSKFVIGSLPSTPCAVSDVISFGNSQTGQLLRDFYLQGLNTELAGGDDFDDGLLFEGSIHATTGGSCRKLTDDAPFFAYSMENCEEATPASQGKVFTINAETDVQILGGWRARGEDEHDSHYRTYEITGTSHLPKSEFDLKELRLRDLDTPEQNYVDFTPVFRALMQNLFDWIKEGDDPPNSANIEGEVGLADSPLFSTNSWGNHRREVFITDLGIDGNALGGVRLVHVRTLENNEEIGGPLGLYRGAECFNDSTEPDYVLGCGGQSDTDIYAVNGGTFIPYTQVNTTLCEEFYEDHEAYVTAIREAGDVAAEKRWILPEEIDQLVAKAESRAGEFGGCVPPISP